MFGLTNFETLTIFAVILAPILAFQLQKWDAHRKEYKSRQLHIFRTLMVEHTENNSVEYATALNLIPIDFAGKNEKEQLVIAAWKNLLNHYVNYPEKSEYKKLSKKARKIAEKKAEEYLNNLIFEMSKCLGYCFDKNDIKSEGYVPTDYDEEKDDKKLIRDLLINLLCGHEPLDVNIKSSPKNISSKTAKTKK